MHPFEQQVVRFWPGVRDSQHSLMIACSGGPDSTALVRLLANVRSERSSLSVVHFNHGLRGEASDNDERFVASLCETQGLEFLVGRAKPGEIEAKTPGLGLEAAARQVRYDFILSLARKRGDRYVATGHNADDHIETVLLNVVRGTGLAGLAGIPFVRTAGEAVSIVRPLLDQPRQSIEDYLSDLKQPTQHDHHNDERQFRRNRIRHEILPLLEESIHPGVRGSLKQLSKLAAEAQDAIQSAAESLLQQCLVRLEGDSCELDLSSKNRHQLPPIHLRREMFVVLWKQLDWPLQSMSFQHWQRLAELFEPGETSNQRHSNQVREEKLPEFPGRVIAKRTSKGRIRLSVER